MKNVINDRRIKSVESTVKKIETLRRNLFIKLLPPLYHDHFARTIFDDKNTWVLVTSNKNILEKIEHVEIDYTADIGKHIKLWDESKNPIDVPKDIVVLFSNIGGNAEIIKEIDKKVSEIGMNDTENNT